MRSTISIIISTSARLYSSERRQLLGGRAEVERLAGFALLGALPRGPASLRIASMPFLLLRVSIFSAAAAASSRRRQRAR